MKSAVILLSGGLDSATVLAMARSDGFTCHTLSLDYGQRHRSELDAAAETMGANDIFFGANAVDYSGYPDCRPDALQLKILALTLFRSGAIPPPS